VQVEQVGEGTAVLVDDVDHGVEPVGAEGPGGHGRRDRHDVRGAEVVPGQLVEHPADTGVTGVHHRPTEAGEVERLRRRVHRDRPGSDTSGPERLERDVRVPGHDEVGVDLVGDHDEVVLRGELGDLLQLLRSNT
jgi:hypothetical protein